MLPFCQISIIDGPNPNHSCYIDGHLICVVSKELNEDRSKHDLHLRISLSNSYEFDSLRTSTRILIDLLRDKIQGDPSAGGKGYVDISSVSENLGMSRN